MAEIRDINIKNVEITNVNIPVWMETPPQAIPPFVPVTQTVGVPIIDMPGCVEAHAENKKGKNDNLTGDDPKGAKIFCDGGMPSFNPINYNPEPEKTNIRPSELPKIPPPKPEAPDTSVPKIPKTEAPMPECPTRAQQLKDPVGKIVEGNKKLVKYEMVGKECLPVFEELSIPDQIVQNIPSAGMVTTTASIAVVATSSALLAKPLADLLLKVIKPTIKKVMKKITTLRGKKTQVESSKERRDQQRIRSHAIRKLKGKE